MSLNASRMGYDEQHTIAGQLGDGVEAPERDGAVEAGAPVVLGFGERWWLLAVGLLHVLVGPSLTGSGAGSRAGEAKKPRRRVQGPSARLGLLRRALEADPEPVTIAAGREGARPPQVTAA